MSLSKEELVLTACFLKSTDMSISIEDALGCEANLHESPRVV